MCAYMHTCTHAPTRVCACARQGCASADVWAWRALCGGEEHSERDNSLVSVVHSPLPNIYKEHDQYQLYKLVHREETHFIRFLNTLTTLISNIEVCSELQPSFWG